MQSTNSEYGSPYLATCHVTFTFTFSLSNTEASPQGANKARLDFAKKTSKKAKPLLQKHSLDAGIKINLHQNDRKKKVWKRLGTAHDPKLTTSSVKHGGGSVMA